VDDDEVLRSLGIDPTPTPPRPSAQRARRPVQTEDDVRGLAKLQGIIRESRDKSFIKRSDKWLVRVRSPRSSERSTFQFGVDVDIDRTPHKGDVIVVRMEGVGRDFDFDFALIERVVATGGVNVRFCKWHETDAPLFTKPYRVTRYELLSGAYHIEGVVTTPELLKLRSRLVNGVWTPFGSGEPSVDADVTSAITAQRASAAIPRLSGLQGARDDRIRSSFSVLLDCEELPKVGDDIVTRWRCGDELLEQIDTVIGINDAGLELEAFFGGDGSFVATVTADMLRRREVSFEGIIRKGSPLKRPN
jgi:hypothetical protein